MSNEEIVKLAQEMGFKLDYDRSDKSKNSEGLQARLSNFLFIRFVSIDDSLDERELRWVWYCDETDSSNIENGKRINERLKRKKEIQDFLRY